MRHMNAAGSVWLHQGARVQPGMVIITVALTTHVNKRQTL
jgi:hypothetical protein